MSVFDLQKYLQERLTAYDEGLDVSPGSPLDVQVIQPVLRRLGTDPFTVDLGVFLYERLRQAFPELATEEGDGITDVLVKPATLLWDAIVREIYRVRACQSVKDPTTLTLEEAEALGANLFSDRERGDYARGVGRLYFAQPRAVSVTPVNFFTSRSNLHFFPDGVQDITTDEMLLNTQDGLYYFDVNCVAEGPGTAYNIDKDELSNVANLEGVVRVTNPRRFRAGLDAEDAVTYLGRAQQELTERSMVTVRGLGARIPKAFPEVTRLAVVGCGDPEMGRDVLRGGGLGEILLAGTAGCSVQDPEGRPLTRRFRAQDDGVDFLDMLDVHRPGSYVLTVFGGFSDTPAVRDLPVKSFLDGTTLELEDQVLVSYTTDRPWCLRKRELTLSGIPGGILFPQTESGLVTVPDGAVHVGGHFDVSVRGGDLDTSTLVLDSVTDASPAAQGNNLQCSATSTVTLTDLVLGTNYAVGDDTHTALAMAKQHGYTLQILTGVNAGSHRVLDVVQPSGTSPIVTLDSATTVVAGSYKWQLVDTIDINLVEPNRVQATGSDLQSVQGQYVLYASSSTDFAALGVGEGSVLRIQNGLDADDYAVLSLPAFNAVRVGTAMRATAGSLRYTIFVPNAGGGVVLPFVRVSKVSLLDTAGQPVGTSIPYARPVDIQSRSFENPGRGVKLELTDASLGIITQKQPTAGFAVGNQSLVLSLYAAGVVTTVNVVFTSGNKTHQQLVTELNLAAQTQLGQGSVLAKSLFDGDAHRVGLIPLTQYMEVVGGSARVALFGTTETRTTLDVRSDAVEAVGGWHTVTPAIDQDDLDAVQVLDGYQLGCYGKLRVGSTSTASLCAGSLSDLTFPTFAPEVGRHVIVGARSIGSARCFFLEPTSIEFTRDSIFTATAQDGSSVQFFPDPTQSCVRIPAYPSTSYIKDGVTDGTQFVSESQDFVLSSIVPGDELVIHYVPISGTSTLPSAVAVANRQLVLSVGGNADQTITFATDSSTVLATEVTRAGVVSQINSAVGKAIAKLSATNRLELEGDVSIIVRGSSATTSANAVLGFPTYDRNNTAASAGTYTITYVGSSLQVTPAFTAAEALVAYEIRRPGMQRTASTQMAKQKDQTGLYFCDVELVSAGVGDSNNIDSDLQLTATGYRSDGYYLTTDDSNLTFSATERPRLHVSRSILEVGTSDDPRNATQLTGQNLEITYDRSSLVADTQNLISSETERVVCANPLARHLIPHFVRFVLEYTGGSTADVVSADLESYIRKVYPAGSLTVSDIISLVSRRGGSNVTSPLELLAIVHNYDRSIVVQRSKNALSTGRLSAFIPDGFTVNRKVS